MDYSTFAFVIGIILILEGIPLSFATAKAEKWINAFMKDDIHPRVAGVLMVIIAALFLREGYEISADFEGIVRFLGWIVALKGVLYTWWPEDINSFRKSFFKNQSTLALSGMVAAALGIVLVYGSFGV